MRTRIGSLFSVAAIILIFAGTAEADWFKLIAPDVGWVVEPPNQLLWTNDGGLHWRDLNPPVSIEWGISAVCFKDQEQGWVLLSSGEPAVPGALQFTLASTKDEGATWSTQPLTMPPRISKWAFNGGASLAFADPLHGIAILDIGFTPIPGGGAVLVTSDGGKTWQATPQGMQSEVTLVTPQSAWAVSGGVNEELYVTRDGATTWQKVEIPSPIDTDLLKQSKANVEQFWKSYLHGLNPAETAEANDTRQRQSQTFGHYELPVFKDASHGYIVVSYPGVAVLFLTNDGGMTWKADRVVTGTGIGKSSIADSTWISAEVPRHGLPRLRKLGPGAQAVANTVFGPENSPPAEISFANANQGWLFTLRGRLLATNDGGVSWTDVTPGQPPQAMTP